MQTCESYSLSKHINMDEMGMLVIEMISIEFGLALGVRHAEQKSGNSMDWESFIQTVHIM